MKYNIYSNAVNEQTQTKLAELRKPFCIVKTVVKNDVFLFRDKLVVEKQMDAAVTREREMIYGNRS